MKPILFNTDMTAAILDGRKTVTRRLIKPQPGENAKMMYTFAGSHKSDIGKWIDWNNKNSRKWTPPCNGDNILYVRETWAKMVDLGTISEDGYVYRADFNASEILEMDAKHFRWRPSIHMPKEAARIFLKVKSVRVERLKEASASDAMAEGFTDWNEFVSLWNNTIKTADLHTYGWDANPWVWVIEFERCDKPKEE